MKRTIMVSDMSRIKWNKKNTTQGQSTSKSFKGKKAATGDCSSAKAFFNFLNQK
ncbi:hypothetical protein [Dysgonomonas capnocytophagoides]|uniref:hypothetical protein n=1 Tax=Dysgonomonas capnocytophagoides TaxID=45254 RepID=UPI0030C7AD63